MPKTIRSSQAVRPSLAPPCSITSTWSLLLCILIMVSLLQPTHAAASIIYVAPGGIGNGTSWTSTTDLTPALINEAPSGSEIWLTSGVYRPGIDRTASFVLKNGVAIYGGFAGTETMRDQRDWIAHQTILSGDIDFNDSQQPLITDTSTVTGTDNNSYHVVFSSDTDSSAVLDGVVITAGAANGTNSLGYGGGIYNFAGNPQLTNITFKGNRADVGGGMYSENGRPTLSNSIFNNNRAQWGGGMFNYSASNTLLTNITFSDNHAVSIGGGLVNYTDSSPLINGATFTNNSSIDGAGMYNIHNSRPTITNSIFKDNSATNGGGIYNTDYSSPIIINTTISGNNATNIGGGISNIDSSNAIMTNVIISGNHAADRGGGIASANSSPIMTNITVSGNRADGDGGGIYNFSSGSSPQIRKSIIWGTAVALSI